MNLKKILFCLFVFFISVVSSATLSMSPPQVDFLGEKNEIICQNILIKVEGSEKLIGSTRWAEEGYFERDLLEHNLKAEELDLEIFIPEYLFVSGDEEIEVCVSGKRSGDYHGLLLYKIEKKPAQVGIWLNVSISGKNNFDITGDIINGEEEKGSWWMISLILLIVLGILFLKLKKKKRE